MKTKPEGKKVLVSERALMQRINRKLAPQSQQLLRNKDSSRWLDTTGRFSVVDHATNSNIDYHVKLEPYGRELGVLKPYEALAEDA